MKNINKWFKRKLATMSMALSNVEKNMLNQKGESLETDANIVKRHTEGQLADSLINGVITQEVANLRWRTYKILNQAQNVSSKIVGYDKSGYPILEINKVDKENELKNINLDKSDKYELEMVIFNTPITIGVNDIMENKYVKTNITPEINEKEKTASLASINGDDYYNTFKTERPIKIERTFHPKFMIENYTNKVNIRKIDDENKILEFCISKYPNEYDKKSTLLINHIKKAIKNPSSVNFLELAKISFITYKSLGVVDSLMFEYDNVLFDKIVEFNGDYLIKFKARVKTNGEPIFDKYRIYELDNKYENKERRK